MTNTSIAFPSVSTPSPTANMFWNATGYAVGIVITFLLSPFLVRHLGDSQYGVLALVAEITSYYGLADLGIRGAVGYFVTRHSVNKDLAAFRQTVHTAFWILIPAACGIMLIGGGIAYLAPHWIKLGGVPAKLVQQVIVISTASFACGLPGAILTAILYGLRRLDLTNMTELTHRVLVGILSVAVILTDGGLLEFVIVQGIALIARALLEAAIVKRLGFPIPVFPPHPVRTEVRELMRYGSGNATINFAQMIVSQLHLTVIATFLATTYVTPFAIARSLVAYFSVSISMITWSFTPQFTYMNELKQHDEVIRFYMGVSRLTALLGTWLATGIFVFVKPFLGLWMGQRFVEGDLLYRSDVIAVLLTAGVYWRVLQSVALQVLLGTRRLRFLTLLACTEAAANLILSLILLRFLGLAGVALGTALPQFIVYGFVMPFYMIRIYQLPLGLYAKSVWRPALVAAVSMWLPGWVLVEYAYPRNMIELAAIGAVASAVSFSIIYAFELTTADRLKLKAKILRLS